MTMEEIAQKREAIRQRKLLEDSGTQPVTETKPQTEMAVNQEEEESDEKVEFLAFARVFSGTLKKGQTVFILSPKHNPDDFIEKVIIQFSN